MDPLERQRLEEQLSAWLDGELSQPEQQELQQLLARSAEARALLAELQKTVGLVRQLPRASSPDDLYDSIVARLERTALLGPPARAALPAGRAWRWRGLWALAASAAVVLVALGVGYWFVGARSGPERDAGRPGRQLARGPEAAELKHPRISPPAGELGRRPAGPGTQQPERPALPERLARKRGARRAGGGKEAERSGVGLAEAPVGPQAQLLRPRRRRPSRPPQPSAEPLARAAPAATAMVEADLAATRPVRGSDRRSLARPGPGLAKRVVGLDVLV
ncbi:MAG: hypothetical protein ACE5K7_07235, partial [Phycisphaerae bacterium]